MKTKVDSLYILINQYRPFIKDRNFGPDEIIDMLVKGIRKQYHSEYKDLVKQLADIGIHSPRLDPNMNKFNVLVDRARNLIIKDI